MTRFTLVILGLLVWTSLSVSNDDGDYDYIGEDEDTYDVMNDVEESTEALSAEGKECLLNLINDCLVENEGLAEACEGLTKQLEVSIYFTTFEVKLLILSIFRASLTMMSRTSAMCPGLLVKPISRPKESLI